MLNKLPPLKETPSQTAGPYVHIGMLIDTIGDAEVNTTDAAHVWTGCHLLTMNVLYCDGHVKSTRVGNLIHRNDAGTVTAFTVQDD